MRPRVMRPTVPPHRRRTWRPRGTSSRTTIGIKAPREFHVTPEKLRKALQFGGEELDEALALVRSQSTSGLLLTGWCHHNSRQADAIRSGDDSVEAMSME